MGHTSKCYTDNLKSPPRWPEWRKTWLSHITVYHLWGFPPGAVVKNPTANTGDVVQSLGQEDLLEKEIATHSNILVWKIPWTQEPGMLQSLGSQRIGHDLATKQQQYVIYDQTSYHWSYSSKKKEMKELRVCATKIHGFRTLDIPPKKFIISLLFPIPRPKTAANLSGCKEALRENSKRWKNQVSMLLMSKST